VIAFFIAKHCQQAHSFNGMDLELWHWQDIETDGREISKTDVEEVDDGAYHVHSHLDPQHWHDLSLHSGHCNFPSYPLISFCKHLSAIQTHFPQACCIVWFHAVTAPSITKVDTGMRISLLSEANLNVPHQ
jgi:hypothetical protein